LIFFRFFYGIFTFDFSSKTTKMSFKLAKLFIDFTSDIVSSNSALEYDEFKKTLMNKDVRHKFEEFLKINKIKQKKDKKDPTSDEPKKPKSSYIIFCSAERDAIVDANPGVEHKEVTSLLGQRWKEIQANNKDLFQKYVDEAAKEKAEYEEKMKAYRILHNIPEKIEKVKKPKVVKPEKAMSPFYYYLKDMESEVAEANPGMKKKDIHEKIKADWKELKDEKDDIVKKYKKIAKDKRNDLTLTTTSISSSTPASPLRMPSTPGSCPATPGNHFVSSPMPLTPGASPVIVKKKTDDEEKPKKKKKNDEEKPKKKKKKDSDAEEKPKKKKIIRVVEKDDDESDLDLDA
jgi:hypothetical protein